MNYGEVLNQIRKFGSQGTAMILGMSGAGEFEVSAEGPWIRGHLGKRFLDCGSFALFLFGHSHPLFKKELGSLFHEGLSGTSRILCHAEHALALEKIVSLAPLHMQKAMLLNSGAEAVEAAIKLCRLATRRKKIAHLSHSYHGKTAGALSITDYSAFHSAHHPVLQDTVRIDRNSSPEQLSDLLSDPDLAGLFIEPIQGEGGIFSIEPQFLQAAERLCRKNGTLLVLDEIQCGLGRSGNLWAFEKSGVKPDILLSGKALGGGIVPVSAMIATREAFLPLDRNPFMHTSTYSGNPLACRAVLTTHQIVTDPAFLPTVRSSSSLLTRRLDRLVQEYPQQITKWSGTGLMLGIHFTTPAHAAFAIENCLKAGLILSPCLSSPQVLRVSPPYLLTEADAAFFYDCLNHVLKARSSAYAKS